MTFVARASRTAVLAGSFGLLATACGASRPATTATSPSAENATAPTTATASQPNGSSSPTSGTIAVSEDIRKACGLSDQDAYFPYDSAALESQDVGPLSAVARCFTSGPLKGRTLQLVGRADPRGPNDYNIALGMRRADSVEKYLDRHGVPREKIDTSSRGAMDATGTDESGWAKDRRVDVLLGS